MSNKPEEKPCTLCTKMGLKPFTRDNVLNHYVPLTSMISYAGLAVNVMNPPLAARLLPKRDITNVLLTCTLIGTTFYIYNRPHLYEIAPSTSKRTAYSVLGSALFGLGSILLWAIIRSELPQNSPLATTLGVVSGAAIVKLGHDYFEECDKKAAFIQP